MLRILLILLVAVPSLAQPLPKLRNEPFRYPLNTQNDEYNPVISPDGSYIVFQSNRPGGKGNSDIWISINGNNREREGIPDWMEAANFSDPQMDSTRSRSNCQVFENGAETHLNTPKFEGGFSIRFEAGQPTEIFFTSERVGPNLREGFDGLNIYYTQLQENGCWSDAVHLNSINSNFNDKMPAISPDGKRLVFSTDRPGSYGGYDLWMSERNLESNTWSEPANLGSVLNSSQDETNPYFHYDSTSLYFSSNRNDPQRKFKLYVSEIQEGNYSAPMILPEPFNQEGSDSESMSLTQDGLWLYFASNRANGQGQFDIYRAQVPTSLRNSYQFQFHGLVLDGSEKKMIGVESALKIFDERKPIRVITSTREIGVQETDKNPTNFNTFLQTGHNYRVEISAPGFHPTELYLDLRGNIGEAKSRYERIVLQPIEHKPAKPIASAHPWTVQVLDEKTGKSISNAEVTVMTNSNRKGYKIPKIADEQKFNFQPLPQEDFDLFAEAEGYQPETKAIPIQEILNSSGKDFVLYLKALAEIPDEFKTIIYFDFNKKVLTKDDQTKLKQLAVYLSEHKDVEIEIGGHTDNIATKEYNVRLSRERALSVQKFLTKNGISEDRLHIRAYWYSQPAAPNETEKGRALNRRVTFKLWKPEHPKSN